jgi:hypothetical protein
MAARLCATTRRFPAEAQAYRLKSARGAATVGYHGSIWLADGKWTGPEG